jgi:hypothetical protein
MCHAEPVEPVLAYVVFPPRQGRYALHAAALAAGPAPGLQAGSIAALLTHDAHLLARRSNP